MKPAFIAAVTKNAIFRFFRLYMPLSHTRYFTWNRDNDYADANDCDISLVICSEKMDDHLQIDLTEDIRKKLISLGFRVELSDAPLWYPEQGIREYQADIFLSDGLIKNSTMLLKKENGYPELFTLDDYFIKVLSLLKGKSGYAYREIHSILDNACLSSQEKLVAFQKAVFHYSRSSFQKESVKSVLREFLIDLPAIIEVQRDQLEKLTVLESNPLLRQQIRAGESTRLIKISELIKKQFPDPKQNKQAAALLASMAGLFSDFISKDDMNGPVEIVLGFLVKEQLSHPISSSFSFLKSSKENAQYAKKVAALIADIKAYLIDEKIDMRALPDKHVIKMHDQHINKGKAFTRNVKK